MKSDKKAAVQKMLTAEEYLEKMAAGNTKAGTHRLISDVDMPEWGREMAFAEIFYG